MAHPGDPLGPGDLAVLAGAVAVFVGGLLDLQWQAVRFLAPERIAAIVGVVALCWILGPAIPGVLLLAVVALVIGAIQAISVRRFERVQARNAARRADG